MKTLLKNRELSAFLAIVVLFAGLVALNPAYFSLQTLDDFRQLADPLPAGAGGDAGDADPQYRRFGGLHRRPERYRGRGAE
jgi:hypothetical protein